jgi:hypothetical protein
MGDNKDLTTSYLDAINNRTIEIKREVDKLKYLFELKKSKSIASTVKNMSEDDKKVYETKRKMYLGKLNKEEIKAPKPETLEYYNIYKDDKEYKIKD